MFNKDFKSLNYMDYQRTRDKFGDAIMCTTEYFENVQSVAFSKKMLIN